MFAHHLPQRVDLLVQDGDEGDLSGHDRRERRLHRAGLAQLLRVQQGQDRVRT